MEETLSVRQRIERLKLNNSTTLQPHSHSPTLDPKGAVMIQGILPKMKNNSSPKPSFEQGALFQPQSFKKKPEIQLKHMMEIENPFLDESESGQGTEGINTVISPVSFTTNSTLNSPKIITKVSMSRENSGGYKEESNGSLGIKKQIPEINVNLSSPKVIDRINIPRDNSVGESNVNLGIKKQIPEIDSSLNSSNVIRKVLMSRENSTSSTGTSNLSTGINKQIPQINVGLNSPKVINKVYMSRENSTGSTTESSGSLGTQRKVPELPSKPKLNVIVNSTTTTNKPMLPPKPKLNQANSKPQLSSKPSIRHQSNYSGIGNHSQWREVLKRSNKVYMENENNPTLPYIGYQDLFSKGNNRCSLTIRGKLYVATNQQLKLYDITTSGLLKEINFNSHLMGIINNNNEIISFNYLKTKDKILIGFNDGLLILWDLELKQYYILRKKKNMTFIMNLLNNKEELISITNQSIIYYFNLMDLNENIKLKLDFTIYENTLNNNNHSIEINNNIIITEDNKLWYCYGKTILIFQLDYQQIELTNKINLNYNQANITGILNYIKKEIILIAHQDGKLSIYHQDTFELINTLTICNYKIQQLLLVKNTFLWLVAVNKIYILNFNNHGLNLIKQFEAHTNSIQCLSTNVEIENYSNNLSLVYSSCEQGQFKFWDGNLTYDWQIIQLQKLSKEYSNYKEIDLRICSFNVGANKPEEVINSKNSDYLLEWIGDGLPDIIVFGFQEVVNLDSKKVTAKSIFQRKEEKKERMISSRYNEWKIQLLNFIQQNYSMDYEILISENMIGLFSLIIIKSELKSQIHLLECVINKTGFGGLHGNKGGILVKFLLHDSSFCFINCHLAAGQKEISNRNQDIFNILKKSQFITTAVTNNNNYNSSYIRTGPISVPWPTIKKEELIYLNKQEGIEPLNYEHLFFSGDLNYRINLDQQAVKNLISYKDYSQLIQFDQLTQLKNSPLPFLLDNFKEEEILFNPTYKYDLYTNNYDTSEKKRVPAYCDRILIKSKNIKCNKYNRIEINCSDHRPIMGWFKVGVKIVNQSKLDKINLYLKNKWEEMA
ncbi:DNase I-like protein [Neoconidiobolus thromboides FSU 785]|nr:DNase I-like protein [Neoconidiobolus thromboides FSU 785]